MPAFRAITKRRRSSLAVGLSQIKPGNYGISSPSPRNVNVTFAPNVTPGTYVESDTTADDASEAVSPENTLFPPSDTPAPPSSRRRDPPGKRRSQGYIPRPPNAFMLFRADFVRQKHVPGSIETTHSSLSKIIGNLWRALPLDERAIWESKAKKEKADHRVKYPDYRFRPVHNKAKKAARRAARMPVSLPEERRCEDIAALMLAGKKGDALVEAVRQYDMQYEHASLSPEPMLAPTAGPSQIHAPQPLYPRRRSSSVPPPTTLYNPITLPSLPFLVNPLQGTGSRGASPVGNISHAQRMFLGQRRASSAQPVPSRAWTLDTYPSASDSGLEAWQLQRDWSPLPAVDTSLFEPGYVQNGGQGAFGCPSEDGSDLFAFPQFPQALAQPTHLALTISPLDAVPPHARLSPFSESSAVSASTAYSYSSDETLAPRWIPGSEPPSAFPSPPAPAPLDSIPLDTSLAADLAQLDGALALDPAQFAAAPVYAPQPVHWEQHLQPAEHQPQFQQAFPHELAMDMGIDMQLGVDMDMGMNMQYDGFGYDPALFDASANVGVGCGERADVFAFADALAPVGAEGY